VTANAVPLVPANFIEDLAVLPILESALACLCTELDRSPGGIPCFCSVVPGDQVAMDFCDCSDAAKGCGMAWVRLDQSFVGSSIFNSIYSRTALNVARCVPLLSHRVQLGVTRCMAGMDSEGNPPSDIDQHEAARIQMGDYAAMIRALNCCFPYDKRREFLFERYIPMGPQGNCVGGYCYFTIRLVQ
jgi:hypothetical protein